MQKLIIPVFFLFVSIFSSAQDRVLEKALDSALTKNFKPKEPGIGVFAARKGQIIYQKAFGSANIELDVPMQPGMVFKVGSITKQFTAIAILQLVEQGKLSLQDSVQKFVPGFPWKGHTVTIEHLLTHTSGIKDYMTIDHPDPFIERHDLAPDYIIDHFKNAPLEFEPGTKYNYTNSGYVLLGKIIETASGQSYHDYMKQHVIDRAGLKHTIYANENKIIPKRVAGYTRDNGFYENAYYQSMSLGFAVGDLLSTLPDLFQWTKAVWENKLVKKELLQKAVTPYRLKNGGQTNYGYGWLLDSLYARRCIYHAGQVNGFIAFEWYFPDEDVFVSLFTNVKSGEDQTSFSGDRFQLFFNIPFIVFGNKVPQEVALTSAVLESYTGTYDLDGRKFIVDRKNDRLYLDVGKPVALHALSETSFFLPGVPSAVTLQFIKDKSGKVTGMNVWQNGLYEWKKVK